MAGWSMQTRINSGWPWNLTRLKKRWGPINKFSDFAEEKPLDGDKVRINDILGKTVIVLAYQLINSKFDDANNKCLKLQLEVDGEKRILFTGSQVLQDLIQKYASMIPFETKIIRQNRYLTFS